MGFPFPNSGAKSFQTSQEVIPSFNMDLTPEIQQEINPEGSQTTGKWKFTYSRSFSPENFEYKG